MLVPIDNIVFDVEYDYEPAHDGGSPRDSLTSEESWPESVILYAVMIACPYTQDLLPYLNKKTVSEIERKILEYRHNRFKE